MRSPPLSPKLKMLGLQKRPCSLIVGSVAVHFKVTQEIKKKRILRGIIDFSHSMVKESNCFFKLVYQAIL